MEGEMDDYNEHKHRTVYCETNADNSCSSDTEEYISDGISEEDELYEEYASDAEEDADEQDEESEEESIEDEDSGEDDEIEPYTVQDINENHSDDSCSPEYVSDDEDISEEEQIDDQFEESPEEDETDLEEYDTDCDECTDAENAGEDELVADDPSSAEEEQFKESPEEDETDLGDYDTDCEECTGAEKAGEEDELVADDPSSALSEIGSFETSDHIDRNRINHKAHTEKMVDEKASEIYDEIVPSAEIIEYNNEHNINADVTDSREYNTDFQEFTDDENAGGEDETNSHLDDRYIEIAYAEIFFDPNVSEPPLELKFSGRTYEICKTIEVCIGSEKEKIFFSCDCLFCINLGRKCELELLTPDGKNLDADSEVCPKDIDNSEIIQKIGKHLKRNFRTTTYGKIHLEDTNELRRYFMIEGILFLMSQEENLTLIYNAFREDTRTHDKIHFTIPNNSPESFISKLRLNFGKWKEEYWDKKREVYISIFEDIPLYDSENDINEQNVPKCSESYTTTWTYNFDTIWPRHINYSANTYSFAELIDEHSPEKYFVGDTSEEEIICDNTAYQNEGSFKPTEDQRPSSNEESSDEYKDGEDAFAYGDEVQFNDSCSQEYTPDDEEIPEEEADELEYGDRAIDAGHYNDSSSQEYIEDNKGIPEEEDADKKYGEYSDSSDNCESKSEDNIIEMIKLYSTLRSNSRFSLAGSTNKRPGNNDSDSIGNTIMEIDDNCTSSEDNDNILKPLERNSTLRSNSSIFLSDQTNKRSKVIDCDSGGNMEMVDQYQENVITHHGEAIRSNDKTSINVFDDHRTLKSGVNLIEKIERPSTLSSTSRLRDDQTIKRSEVKVCDSISNIEMVDSNKSPSDVKIVLEKMDITNQNPHLAGGVVEDDISITKYGTKKHQRTIEDGARNGEILKFSSTDQCNRRLERVDSASYANKSVDSDRTNEGVDIPYKTIDLRNWISPTNHLEVDVLNFKVTEHRNALTESKIPDEKKYTSFSTGCSISPNGRDNSEYINVLPTAAVTEDIPSSSCESKSSVNRTSDEKNKNSSEENSEILTKVCQDSIDVKQCNKSKSHYETMPSISSNDPTVNSNEKGSLSGTVCRKCNKTRQSKQSTDCCDCSDNDSMSSFEIVEDFDLDRDFGPLLDGRPASGESSNNRGGWSDWFQIFRK